MRSYIHSTVASNFSNCKSPPPPPIQLSSILDSIHTDLQYTEPSNLFCKLKPNFAFSSKVICLLFGLLTMGFGNFPDLGGATGCGQDFSAVGTETTAPEARIGTGGLNTIAGEGTELVFLAMRICLGAPGSTICSVGSQVICCGPTALLSSASEF